MRILLTIAAACVLSLLGCKKSAETEGILPHENNDPNYLAITKMAGNQAPLFSSATLKELSEARAASAKYHDIDVALEAGYIDIDYVVPHMGHHFLNPAFLDASFDPAEPEILVYQLSDKGKYKLVALEYAWQDDDMSNPPSGFTGDMDVWNLFSGVGPWVCHAWIWNQNPDGIFKSMNMSLP